MFPPIYNTVKTESDVIAALGNNPLRFFPFGMATQNTPLPYAVWQIVSGSPDNYLNQVPDIDRYTVQVDVYATKESDARNAAQALRNAIEPVAHIVSWRGESVDPETKYKRYSFDVDWHVKRQ